MGRSGCRLPGHNGSEALVFPLHTNAQPRHRRAAPAAALSLPCGSEPIFPLPQQHAELGETHAVSAVPRCQRNRFTLRPKPLPLPGPTLPSEGDWRAGAAAALLSWGARGSCVRGCQGPR